MSDESCDLPALRKLAECVLGAEHETWWLRPSMWLDGQIPAEIVQNNTGRKLIFEYLKRVESGTYT